MLRPKQTTSGVIVENFSVDNIGNDSKYFRSRYVPLSVHSGPDGRR